MKNVLRLIVWLFCVVVLFPQAVSAKDDVSKPPENVMKVIKSHKELSKFAGLIEDTGLENVLESKEEHYTVFAPTNEALGNVPSDVMKRAKADKDHLKSFVKYHIISGSEVFFTNIKGRRAGPAAMSGETLGFEGTGKVVKVNDAAFVTPDLTSGNGVVHVVDAAMIPPSIKEDPAKKAAKELEMAKPPEMLPIEKAKSGAVKPGAVPPGIPKSLPAATSTGLPAASSTGLPAETATGLPEEATSTGVQATVPAPIAPPVPPALPAQEEKKGWWQKLLGK